MADEWPFPETPDGSSCGGEDRDDPGSWDDPSIVDEPEEVGDAVPDRPR